MTEAADLDRFAVRHIAGQARAGFDRAQARERREREGFAEGGFEQVGAVGADREQELVVLAVLQGVFEDRFAVRLRERLRGVGDGQGRHVDAGVEFRSQESGQVFGESVREVGASRHFAVAAEPFAFGETRGEIEVLAVEGAAELARDEERIAGGAGLAGQDAVREALDCERPEERTVGAAADVAADDTQAGLGGGTSGAMGDMRAVSDRLATTTSAMNDAIDKFLRVVSGDVQEMRRAA